MGNEDNEVKEGEMARTRESMGTMGEWNWKEKLTKQV